MSHMDLNVQFFSYLDNLPHLKIVTTDPYDLSLNILFVLSSEKCLRTAYANAYPEAEKLSYYWLGIFDQIRRRHKLTILHHQTVRIARASSPPPAIEDLKNYADVLPEQLMLYPDDFFEFIGIKTIALSGNLLSEQNTVINGFYFHDSILLNVSCLIPYEIHAKTIHHEIYHAIEAKVKHDQTKRGIVAANCRAETFALLMLDPECVTSTERSHSKQVKEIIRLLGRYSHLLEGKKSVNLSPVAVTRRDRPAALLKPANKLTYAVFAGLRNTHFNAFLGIMNQYGIEALPEIEEIREIPKDTSLFLITMNPIDYCSSEYFERGILPSESINIWIELHSRIRPICGAILKNEAVSIFDSLQIKGFLKSLEIQCPLESIYDQIEEPRKYNVEDVPLLNRVWEVYRKNPIVTQMGYDQTPIEE